jgi:hypothetical protein
MAGNKSSFNSNLNGSDNNATADALKELRKTVDSVMKSRFKNDPNKANSEANALMDKLLKSAKAQDILAGKTAAQRRKEELENAKKVALLQMEAATGFKEKTKAAGEYLKTGLKEGLNEAANKLANNVANVGAAFD